MAVHMSTIVSRKTVDILSHLSQLRPTLASHPLLYTISVSQHTDSTDLSQLVASLKSLSGSSIGCLSAPIPSARPSWQQYTAVSVASFDAKYATTFRSTIAGRKAAQVGRWHAMHQKEKQQDTQDYSQDIDWESALSRSYESDAVLPELRDLSDKDTDSILYLSDNAPEGLNSVLSRFSSASKLGLIATSTPFVTGRPYTLFYNDSIHSDGAVGICLSSGPCSSAWSEYPGLEAITRPMIVTNAEGNLVNALDNANPSRLLLHAIQNHPAVAASAEHISKDLQLYLGTLKQVGVSHQLDQLFYIMSGDPSRGSIALDTDTAPPEGSMVQFFLLPPTTKPDVLNEVLNQGTPQRSLAFASTSLDDLNAALPDVPDAEGPAGTMILHDTFVAASENGCIVSRATGGKSERPWKCSLPGSLMGLRWGV
ncbi:hypothetical protein L226DRAFT_477042 [Lentinus tigrinus ALCF2SS1-7]|uniref:FIST domain-containing protein n=1 Tax=Lentinus tigrinus ALCF2SS1-6 TaxID=1328759 RepID=A0A5C2SVC0_9APHY|nr:hypothetical protein L227DRAFT_537774 [Lentinus tigrinus ALCF2SS1-6]RPD80932.1 hypothetical protein L226DRAFT_477042 [Lentinus tigrinus ALCF2SS1-7]